MANLLDLPDELLVGVISSLVSVLKCTSTSGVKSTCFIEWAIESTRAARLCLMVNQGLQSLTIVCRRLHGLVRPFMLNDISLIRGHNFQGYSD